jgi:hypothetical protein
MRQFLPSRGWLACPDSLNRLTAPALIAGRRPSLRFIWRQTMFQFQDLFQWDRFITPAIIKVFYWLAIALVILFGISGIFPR